MSKLEMRDAQKSDHSLQCHALIIDQYPFTRYENLGSQPILLNFSSKRTAAYTPFVTHRGPAGPLCVTNGD